MLSLRLGSEGGNCLDEMDAWDTTISPSYSSSRERVPLFIVEYPDCSFHIKLSSFQRQLPLIVPVSVSLRCLSRRVTQSSGNHVGRIILLCVLKRAVSHFKLDKGQRARFINRRERIFRECPPATECPPFRNRDSRLVAIPRSLFRAWSKVDLSKSVTGAGNTRNAYTSFIARALAFRGPWATPFPKANASTPIQISTVCSC